jgi:DNA polymerase-3 subunit gamma/tau
MSQALYRKWRPRAWDEVVSQEHVIQTLRNAVTGDRVVHAYLFSGPRGTGKTTAARLLAKAVNCLNEDRAKRPCNECAHCVAVNENRFLDLIEIDAASNTSVEDVRDLRDKINFSPTQGRFKIYIIDEVHMLSTAAFNALLKTLEEPPPHAMFILATTEIHKIPATVLSRCQRHEFRRMPMGESVKQLALICKKEKIPHHPDALVAIARQSAGGMRDAISLLDQLASTGEKVTVELVQTVLGTATSATVVGLVDAIQAADPAAGLAAIHTALDAGTDSRALARQIVDYLRSVMLIQMGNGDQVEAPADVRARMNAHAGAFSGHDILRMTRAFNAAANDLRGGWQPALSLELALAELLEPERALAPAESSTRRAPAQPPGFMPGVRNAGGTTPPAQTPAPALARSTSTGSGTAGPASAKEAEATPKTIATPPAKRTDSPPAASPPPQASRRPADAAAKKAESAGTVPTLEQVAAAWKEMMPVLKREHPQLEALLRSARSHEMADGVLVLGFASEVLASKMQSPEMMEPARQALRAALGADLPIRCIVASGSGKSTPPDVRPDGMVAAALQNGGEIVDIQ